MGGRSVEGQITKALQRCDGKTVSGPILKLPQLLKLNCGSERFRDALNSLVRQEKIVRESVGKRVTITLVE
jgi:hypothetical protein